MKKAICIVLGLALLFQVFAYNPAKKDVEQMILEVSEELEHELEKHEVTIVNTTYLYYYTQNKNYWTRTTWQETVDKCVYLCQDNKAITAAKAGLFGEKVLQALIVTGEDAWKGFNNWVEEKSSEYQERH